MASISPIRSYWEADLSNTSLTSVTLTGAILHRTNLTGADLSGFFSEGSTENSPPTGLTQAQLDHACAALDNPPKLAENGGLIWNPRPCPT